MNMKNTYSSEMDRKPTNKRRKTMMYLVLKYKARGKPDKKLS
jgi:hypothetical protein